MTLTGAEEDLDGGELSFFPNPVTNELNISGSTSTVEKISIELLDILGKKLMGPTQVQLPYRLDMSKLEQGVYILKVYNGDKVWLARKIIKK